MFHIKLFNTDSEYTTYKGSTDYLEPNLTFVKSSNSLHFNPIPQKAGDIAYWNGSKVVVCPKNSWDSSLGTRVGVVVIPEGFAPDGKTRIVANSYNRYGKNASTQTNNASSGNNFKLPTTDNNGSTSTGSNTYGYLPSDNPSFSNTLSIADNKTYYKGGTPFIPSPYMIDDNGKEKPNPEFSVNIDGYTNPLSDFNGLEYTREIINYTSNNSYANYCWNYNDGVSNLQWYWPSIAELAYLVNRINQIGYGGSSRVYLASNPIYNSVVFQITYNDGQVNCSRAGASGFDYCILPFAKLD